MKWIGAISPVCISGSVSMGVYRYLRGLFVGVLLLVPGCASASTLQLNGSASWDCGFYPGSTGYGAGTMLTFTSVDLQGNPVSGRLDWGMPHTSPVCTPGLQVFQDTLVPGGAGALYGSWSYLGENYSTTPVSTTNSACIQRGCYLSVSVDGNDNLAVTLGFETSAGLSYLQLGGTASVTSSSFGQQPITLNGVYEGEFYYSYGTFTVGNVPEPAAWSLFVLGACLLFTIRSGCRDITT